MATIQEFDFNVNLMQAILWQYNDAANLQKILEQKQAWYDLNQTQFWTDWYRDVFNLQTANEFGLNVWAIILEVPILVVVNPTPPSKPTWGFGDFNKNFNNGNFSRTDGGAIVLSPDQARLVLKLRYYQLVSRGTVPEINRVLKNVFGADGHVYLRDNLDMTITYVFDYFPNSKLQFVLEEYDILPRPAGVGVNISIEPPEPWGFGATRENFDNGNFGDL